MATAAITNPLSNTPATAAATTTKKSDAIATNFQAFLGLLTTQLKNQNPLEPLNTNEFTNQLVQFASVEQQLKSNETLTALLASTKAATLTNALGFVGAEVTADGRTSQLENGQASWRLDAPRLSPQAVMTVKNASGSIVFEKRGTLNAGPQDFVWDGRATNGVAMPPGPYTLSVSALDAANTSMTVKTEMTGTVDSVDLSGTEPLLRIGGLSVLMSAVKSIKR